MRYYRYEDDVITASSDHPQPGMVALADEHEDVVAWENPPPRPDDVIAERKRRLALGFEFDFEDARGKHHIGTTKADMEGWDEVTKIAQVLLNGADTSTTIPIITDTGPVEVTAPEWQQILLASAQVRQPIWMASFALQEMDPIPADYADDQWWP